MQESQDAKSRTRLRDIVEAAFDQAIVLVDIPDALIDKTVDAIGKVPHPGAEEVAKIVVTSLEAAGEGAKQAAEVAGGIAETIVDAIGNIDLNV